MPYVGKQLQIGNYIKCDAITTSATATYNLTSNSVAVYPQTATNCIVSLNGVIQAPIDAYTISGSQIIFASALTSSDVIDFITVLGDVLSIGTPTNGTVTSSSLASGTSGLIAWQSVQTSGFTAVAGRGYPCNTTSAAFTVTLPASAAAGDTIVLVDYARKWGTNAITINQNSLKFQGYTSPNPIYNTDGQSVTLVYVDSTQGWIPLTDDDVTNEVPQTYSIDFLVVAGGAGGGSSDHAGGGGAGGYRTSTQSVSPGTVITVTVGDGGAGGVAGSSGSNGNKGSNGSDSSISGSGLTTITSTGGGGGATQGSTTAGNGGSGGGGNSGANPTTGGSGNTPSTSPSQGNNGGTGQPSAPNYGGGGGGGASATGSNGTSSNGGAGGDGTASSITGSSVTYAGGGGGACIAPGTAGAGGAGGGGAGSNGAGSAGTANLGGGGGGSERSPKSNGGAGGKGVVILSMLTTKYTGTTTGSPTVTTSGSNTILKFTGSGSYTT